MGERTRAGAVALACVLLAGLVSGCSGGADPDQSGGSAGSSPTAASPATPTASTASATAAPDDGLTAEERVAFEEATEVVLAYRQTIADLYSGARTDLNDLDKVATGDLLDRGLRNIQQGLSQGYRSEPMGVQLVLVSAEPVSVDLGADPPTVIVSACIDATALTDMDPSGERQPGRRESSDFTVIRLSTSGNWFVDRVTGEADPADRAC
jgi:hypothetical protein